MSMLFFSPLRVVSCGSQSCVQHLPQEFMIENVQILYMIVYVLMLPGVSLPFGAASKNHLHCWCGHLQRLHYPMFVDMPQNPQV